MVLNGSTMRDSVIAQLNLSGFQIDNTVTNYFLIDAACQAFVPTWAAMLADQLPGTAVVHQHSFTGASVNIFIFNYENLMFTLASPFFGVPPQPPALTAMLFWTQCWSQTLLTYLDSVAFITHPMPGAAAHTHELMPPVPPPPTNWLAFNTPVTIQAVANLMKINMDSCMISKMGPTNFKPLDPLSMFQEYTEEFSKAFFTEIRNNSVLLPALGNGHVHGML